MAGKRDKSKEWRRFQRIAFSRENAVKRLRKAEKQTAQHAHKFVLKRWRRARDARNIIVFWMVAIACLVLATGLQATWDSKAYMSTAGAPGGTYIEAIYGNSDTLNPLFAESKVTSAVGKLVFSRLLTYDKTGHLTYDLLKSLDVSEDKKVYTAVLRHDATWHDGEPVTADDVMFTINLLKDESTRASIHGWQGIDVKKRDDYTVRFTLKTPYDVFSSALTFPIVPKHLLGEMDHDKIREAPFNKDPIGSGPFIYKSTQDATIDGAKIIHLVRNDDYYGAEPKLSQIQIMSIDSDDTMLKALHLNEVNGAIDLPTKVVKSMPQDRYIVENQPIEAGVYAFLNNDSTILKDKKIRQALQFATDTNDIRETVGGGVKPLYGPYTPFQLPPKSGDRTAVFDKKKAAKLLDEAGWKIRDGVRHKGGEDLRLSVVTTQNIEYERALETIIGQWRQLGILVNERIIDTSDPTQGFEQSVLQPRDYDVLIYRLELPDKDVYAYWHSSQILNLSNYSSIDANDMLSSSRVAADRGLRQAKHRLFADKWLRDVPAISLYQPVIHNAISGGVRGVSEQPTLVKWTQHYADVANWTVRQRDVYKTP